MIFIVGFFLLCTSTVEAKTGYRTCYHVSRDITAEIIGGAEWTWGMAGELSALIYIEEDTYTINGDNLVASGDLGINGVWTWYGSEPGECRCEWNDDANDTDEDERCHADVLKQIHYFGDYCNEINKYVIDSFAEVVLCERHSVKHYSDISGWYYIIYEAPNFPDDYNHAGAMFGAQAEHYIPLNYMVYFDPKGGTVSKNSVTTTFDSNINSNFNNIPCKKGYIFQGWYDSGGVKVYDVSGQCTNSIYFTNNIWKYPSDLVLYALWKPIQYNLVYDVNNSTDTHPDVTIKYDENVRLDWIPVRYGFTFKEWNTKKDGTGTGYTSGDTVKNLTDINNGYVKLYAQWKKREFQITKVSSTMYKSTMIKRCSGDDQWYKESGFRRIDDLVDVSREECVQVWIIDCNGNIYSNK
ncbi:MAG: InlB B-repeat-containing protein [Eubacteriales bacterium]|nr:InlB B-repeat-containing protein [Eubacteriales bacterium]